MRKPARSTVATATEQLGYMGIVTSIESAVEAMLLQHGLIDGSTELFEPTNALLLASAPFMVPFLKGLYNAWINDGVVTGQEFRQAFGGAVEQAAGEETAKIGGVAQSVADPNFADEPGP